MLISYYDNPWLPKLEGEELSAPAEGRETLKQEGEAPAVLEPALDPEATPTVEAVSAPEAVPVPEAAPAVGPGPVSEDVSVPGAAPAAGIAPASEDATADESAPASGAAQQIQGRAGRRRGREPLRRKRRKPSGVKGFLLALLLLAALTGTAVWLNGGIQSMGPLAAWGNLWDRVDPGQDPGGDRMDSPDDPYSPNDPYNGWEKERDWTADLANTAIERAPTGDGTTLTLTEAGAEQLTPRAIYEKLSPSIVGVRVLAGEKVYMGTGVILSSDGYIVTNAHVVAGGQQVDILLSTNHRLYAQLVGYDKETDLAVLKVNAVNLPVAEFGDSSALRVGDPAYAIGNPLGEELRGTMTDGIISAVDRSVSVQNGEMTLLQTSAALNSGNSGGALCNAAGQVVGITNMKMMADDETLEGLGFAIPSTSVKTVVDEIIETGSFRGWPMLGITVTNHYDEAGNPDGAEVMSVVEGSNAWAKGIRPGHIVTAANGVPVTGIDELLATKKDLKVGDILVLTVRDGRGRTMEVSVIMMSAREMEG